MRDHELWPDFERETSEKAIRDTKIASLAAASIFPVFVILDNFIYPDLALTFLMIRLVVVAVGVGVFFLMNTQFGARFAREFSMFEYVLFSGSISVMVHLDGGYASPYYAGINLILIAFLFILPLDVRRTAIVCAIVYATYIVPILSIGREITDLPLFMNNNFFLLATMVLVILSSYLHTRMRWHEFVARSGLARANEELKELDILKSQFFANVSHEVRTPLTSIISPVQSLYQGDLGAMTTEQQDIVAQVYRNSLRLLDMINQMLDFARFDARKMQLRLSVVDLDETIRELVTVFNEVTRRKGLKLQYLSEVDLPPLYLDAEKLERILSNLIRNSVKFTDHGSIIIRARIEGTWLVVEVEDTGVGIPEAELPVIFERFRQVDGSATRRYEGSGLGLTIVKEAVELQKGQISVVSEEKRGTRFIIKIPTNLEELAPDAFIERRNIERRKRDKPHTGPERRRVPRRRQDVTRLTIEDLAFVDSTTIPPTSDETQPAPSEEKEQPRVLYVEDNEDLRNYVSRMLSRLGHKVDTAVDGQHGWEKLQDALPDVVVSDIMMPRMDGYELLKRMKSEDRTKQVPVILTTAKSEVDSRIEGLQTGADDYLAKPLNMRELDARIRNLVTLRKFQHAVARARELERNMKELSQSFSQSLELKDRYTAGHSHDVLTLGTIIAEEMGLAVDYRVRQSLLLHDIGKLGIPDSILLKNGPLTEQEWDVMKHHATLGAELLRKFESFSEVSDIILAHQERFDGTGYPKGLKGEEIPVIARMIAVADAWHAMTEDRAYRPALSPREAAFELIRNKGRQFDPEMVEAFLRGLLSRKIVEEPDIAAARDLVDQRN